MNKTLVALVAFASCVDVPALTVPDGCQPLEGDISCTLPYPSNFFYDGNVVALRGAGKPQTPSGVDADLVTPLGADGFSRQPAIVCALPDAVVSDGLPNVLDDPRVSMAPARSPTLVLDADTGDVLPHYVDDATHVAISIRPFAQLAPAHRYVVALYGVKNTNGSLAAPAEGRLVGHVDAVRRVQLLHQVDHGRRARRADGRGDARERARQNRPGHLRPRSLGASRSRRPEISPRR